MNKENKNNESEFMKRTDELVSRSIVNMEVIRAAVDETDKLSFFADIERARGKEEFAMGLEFAVRHILDAMAEPIKKYEKEGR